MKMSRKLIRAPDDVEQAANLASQATANGSSETLTLGGIVGWFQANT